MTELRQALGDALKVAMKAKDRNRRDTIRLLQSAIKQVEIDTRAQLDDDAIRDILRREAKKRRESIDELERAGRADDAATERFELAVTEAFLPPQLTTEELSPIVAAAIAEAGATSMKEMGTVMRTVMPRVRGRADGRAVNKIARELLS